jgi:hypothetical protein
MGQMGPEESQSPGTEEETRAEVPEQEGTLLGFDDVPPPGGDEPPAGGDEPPAGGDDPPCPCPCPCDEE